MKSRKVQMEMGEDTENDLSGTSRKGVPAQHCNNGYVEIYEGAW
jgi:hypothetical protein